MKNTLALLIAILGITLLVLARLEVASRFFASGGILLIPFCGFISLMMFIIWRKTVRIPAAVLGLICVIATIVAYTVLPYRMKQIHESLQTKLEQRLKEANIKE